MTLLKIKPKFKRKRSSFFKNKLEVAAHGNTALTAFVVLESSASVMFEGPCKGHSTSAYLWYRVRKGILKVSPVGGTRKHPEIPEPNPKLVLLDSDIIHAGRKRLGLWCL